MAVRDARVCFETERLVLRQLRPEDVDLVLAYLAENRAFHAPYEPVRPAEYYERAFWEERARLDAGGYSESIPFRLFLFAKAGPAELLGIVSFDNFIRGAFQACTLGYMLAERAQGNGYVGEALTAAIAFLFREKNMHRIIASYLTDNERSARVLARQGFVVEGTARDYLRIAGAWRDCVVTSLVNRAWRG